MLTINKKEQIQKRFIFFSCLFIALWLGITPVWASGIGDILVFMATWLINFVCELFLGFIETIANLFLGFMAIKITTLEEIGILAGFAEFTELITIISVILAVIIFISQIMSIMLSPLLGVKQDQPLGTVAIKALIFIPLTSLSQNIFMFALEWIQNIYTSLLDASNNMALINVSGNLDSIQAAVKDDPASQALTGGTAEVVQVLIASLLLIFILWNFVKLIFEMTQRFVAMIVYVYLSPLAMACAMGANSINITKQAVTLFISSGILWILNIWSVGIILSLLNILTEADLSTKPGGMSYIFVWAIVTYGFLKIAQQLDDIFKAVGATNVAFSGSMLDDILSASSITRAASGIIGGALGGAVGMGKSSLRNFAENGLFKVKGNSADNPAVPGINKINDKANAKGANNQNAQTKSTTGISPATSNKSQTFAQQAKTWAAGTAIGTTVGMVASGIGKTRENINERMSSHNTAVNKTADAKASSAFKDAMTKPSPSQRMEAMNNLVKTNPNALKNNAVKEQVADTLGLKENQSITGLSVNDQGRLSATVATKNANGSVGLSTVNGLNDVSKKEISAGASSAEPKKASYRANQLASAGSTNATMTLRDPDGSELSAGISKATGANSSVNGVTDFSVMPSGGSSPINVKAPSDMSAEDVGSIIAGTASKDMMQKFELGGGDASAAMSALNINPESVGSVASSSAWIDDARTSVHLSNSALDDNSGISLQRSSSSPDGDTWTASNHNGENIGSFSVASGTGAREIASTVMSSDGELYDNLRSSGGIEKNSNSTEASFASNTVDTSIGGFGTSDNFSASINDSTGSGQFKYQYASSDGATYESNGFITPSGNVENGKMEYQYGKDGTASGSVYINANISPEDLVAALAHGEGRGIDGIKEIREKLGISTKYSDAETNQVKSLLQKVKDGDTSSENAPVGKHQ